MRREGRTKSGEAASCRACQRSERASRRAGGHARTPDRRSPETHAQAAAAEHDNARRDRRASGTHTRVSEPRTDGTRTNAHTRVFCHYQGEGDAVVPHQVLNRCGFQNPRDASGVESDGRLSSRRTDTPTPSHPPIRRGRGHDGTDSAHPHRTRKRTGSPTRNAGQKKKKKKKKAPAESDARRDVCCLLCDRSAARRRHDTKALFVKKYVSYTTSVIDAHGSPTSCARRTFSSRLTLRRHMGIHQGQKPYGCPLCPYRSRLKASLLQHSRVHTGQPHRLTASQPHRLTASRPPLGLGSSLAVPQLVAPRWPENHIAPEREKPFRCPAPSCSYASIDRSSLLRHSRTHTQQKPYQCPHCSYSCIQKKSLDLHARRHHTGESFPCQQCPYSSPDRQLLLRHVRRHHQPVAASP
ncbi:Zinc finger protein 37A [Merluccius polli]|uniref:Zinc finger protein 37A n=1 Tax=Merluccius polli TaxID=89951 RepID=A0AA47MDX5_MERPO|nr:Zinc finger protein 37A [Merluccius polli]